MRVAVDLLVICLLCLCCALAGAEGADEADEQARIHFDQGIELFEKGKYEEAAIAFERAYELKPSYKILYNIGQVQNELEHYAVALEAYEQYLTEGGDEIAAERVGKVESAIKRLKALVGTIIIDTEVADATVFIDDRRVGATPLVSPLFVDLGKHTVVVKKAGGELHREIVRVAGGQQMVVKFEIVAPAAPVSEPEPPPPPTEPPSDGEPKRVWIWVGFGVGGAAAIGAAITGTAAVSRSSEIKDNCSGNDCPPAVKDDLDQTRALGTVTNVLVGVAAAGVVAGIVLYFVEPGSNGEAHAVALVPAVGPDGAGIGLTGRF